MYRIIAPGIDSAMAPDTIYHWEGNPRTLFIPIALNLIAAWLLLTLLLLAARTPGKLRVTVWAGLLLILPWVVRNDLRLDILPMATPMLDRVLLLAAVLPTVLLVILWRPALVSRFESFIAHASVVLIFIGLFEVVLLGKLTFYACEAGSIPATRPRNHADTGYAIQPHRIIWIVMDELSYQQVYGQRFPGLELPAFDALKGQATRFTHVIPPSLATEVVLPGLLQGKPIQKIRTPLNGQLWVQAAHDGAWTLFDQHDTVFQDAHDAGYGTAVAGWINPYCRLMPQVLDQCFWVAREPIVNGMTPDGTILSNTLAPYGFGLHLIVSLAPGRLRIHLLNLLDVPSREVRRTSAHSQEYQSLYDASDKLLRDPSFGFVFLHLDIPHPWGIYNRRAREFSTSTTSYIDNLALADKCLAGMRATLEQTGQWDSSTVLVMGDHSWRTMIWRAPAFLDAWTPEDESASHGGQYDEPPAYIVKLPGQTTEARVDTPFQSVNTRKLLDAILSQKINSARDLTAWASTMH